MLSERLRAAADGANIVGYVARVFGVHRSTVVRIAKRVGNFTAGRGGRGRFARDACVVSGRSYWQTPPVHTPLKHGKLPAPQG
jgi:hypothetical protein